jgi:hypothetical protein
MPLNLLPPPRDYILDLFETTDRIAMLVLNRDSRETIQRITSAQKASSPEFQAWLRHKDAHGPDIYVTWNRTWWFVLPFAASWFGLTRPGPTPGSFKADSFRSSQQRKGRNKCQRNGLTSKA